MRRVKYERIKQGFGLVAFGALVGIQPPRMKLIDAGQVEPTPAELERLGIALKISPASVLLKECTLTTDPEEIAAERERYQRENAPSYQEAEQEKTGA